MTTLRYALVRGMEYTFQLEDTELDACLVGQKEGKALIYNEAAEGGVGVLQRLVDDQDALAESAHNTLALLHFDPETGKGRTEHPDHRACYECLLNYSNQANAE